MEKPDETLLLKVPLILDVGLKEIILKVTRELAPHWLAYTMLCRSTAKTVLETAGKKTTYSWKSVRAAGGSRGGLWT